MLATKQRARTKVGCEPRGVMFDALKKLWYYEGPRVVLEYLFEGPRGSGKSRPVVSFLNKIAVNYPGSKILVVRKTRHSLTDSFCKTYEEDVLNADMRQLICGDGDRSHRSHYQYPRGSRIVLAGLDKPIKYQSTDWDVVFLEEASELTWKQVEPFFGALRQFTGKIPWQLMLAATNPDAPRHWLNRRAEEGRMVRVKTRHEDNPKWFNKDGSKTPEGEAFLTSLERYTGVERDRHVLGLWRGAEGMVWENFDEDMHVVAERPLGIIECRASVDWGSTAPGCLQVWGVDAEKRMTLLSEVYQTRRNPDWWAAQAVHLCQQHQVSKIVCDPSRPDMIDQFNGWLSRAGLAQMAYGADNRKASRGDGDMGGLSLVRWGFERDDEGVPRIRFLRDARLGQADQELVIAGRPTCTVEEIPEYAHARDATGEIMLEATDPKCADHGCDAMRYMATDNWRRTPRPPETEEYVYPEWTNAGMFGTPESLEKEALRRERGDDDDE